MGGIHTGLHVFYFILMTYIRQVHFSTIYNYKGHVIFKRPW